MPKTFLRYPGVEMTAFSRCLDTAERADEVKPWKHFSPALEVCPPATKSNGALMPGGGV